MRFIPTIADYDAIVIGSGHNGLVCALYLARAGWRVLVLERAAEIGGAVRTAEVTLPGFKHDLFATNVGRFAASPAYQEFRAEFDKTGLRFLSNKFPFASAYPNGKAARIYTDAGLTEREFLAHSNADLQGWRRALALYNRTAPSFLPLYFTALPSAGLFRQVGRLVAAAPRDAIQLARILLQTSRQFVDDFFHSPEIKGLFSPWAFHQDCGSDVRGGATFAFVTAISAYLRGFPIAEGGAGQIIRALRTLLELNGGKILTATDVTRVHVKAARAVAVETAKGEVITAARAIIANVTPRTLYGRLIADGDLPSGFLRRIQRFHYGPATLVVHLALSRKLEWLAAEDLTEFSTVHLCGEAHEIATTYAQCQSGYIPTRPMLVISQTTQLDASRAPLGQHVARIQARAFPYEIVGDATGQIRGRNWQDVKETVADRLVDILEEYAPNAKAALLARHVVSPSDLERENPNLVRGDCNSGSHHLHQFYFCRPMIGWSRYETPIRQLYMIGASTWPGTGVNGSSGYLVAQRLLA